MSKSKKTHKPDETEAGTAAPIAADARTVADMSTADLRALLKARTGEDTAANAAVKGERKLTKLRTYAIRQRAWAEAQTAKAAAACDKADTAEVKLAEYERKLGVDAATETEIAATLAALIKAGRVAQVDSATQIAPEADGTEAEAAEAATAAA